MNGLLTFNLDNAPCLRWKLVAAVKLQWGWPGFLPPYSTRYLTKLVTISTTPTFGYGTPQQSPTTVRSSQWNLDHFDNLTSIIISGSGADADFSYGADLTPDPTHNEQWIVFGDTHFIHIFNNGSVYTQTEVLLSNPYTTAELEADADAEIAAADIADQPWFTWQTVGEVITPLIINIAGAAIPPQFLNADQLRVGPDVMGSLNSAAWSAWVPGGAMAPNGYMKCIGYIAMAGNFCERTFVIDPAFNLLNQTCVSGSGSCANTFKVAPPPLTPGQNAYVTITPNCQCTGG